VSLLQIVMAGCNRNSIKQVTVVLAHLSLFALSGFLAFLLRFDFNIPGRQLVCLWLALSVWLTLKTCVFLLLGLGRGSWRFASVPEARRIVFGNWLSSIVSGAVIFVIASPHFPRSIYCLDFVLCTFLTVGFRFVVRFMLERKATAAEPQGQRAFIYGAGAAGVLLLRESRLNTRLGYKVCGFLDDDADKVGAHIHGLPTLGTGDELPALVAKYRVSVVLIAVPSASGRQMMEILRHCAAAKVQFRTMPGIDEIIRDGGVRKMRDVAVEDLLGRAPVHLDETDIRQKFHAETILITGAAGSIGSELCRQIARFQPRKIVGVDIGETALFDIDREMRGSFPNVPFEPVVGNIRNRSRLAEILEEYRPSVVYHAAAYKHVPMMESHIFEAVENNVLGTYNVAMLAAQAGVRDFVMISSDKAVRPTSVMGLTKRAAELLVNSIQSDGTTYVSVRFGNVLGSNGSVIPIFKEQIARGGPVTITHPEMRRYFMTIPEAAQLVLQASTMARRNCIFVLDMGEPIKIVDLATNLILLSGLEPHKDIAIEYVGVRPGEKLYEELNFLDEDTLPTCHRKIHLFSGPGARISQVATWIRELEQLCAARDVRMVLSLKDLIPEYTPSTHVLKLLDERGAAPAAVPQTGEDSRPKRAIATAAAV
jgi:FlaA1/EpsC-like NDP-sugar epimerase